MRDAVEAFDAGRWTDAQAAFKHAHALRPSARTFRGVGVAACAAGDYVAAVDALEHALVDDRSPLTPEQRTEAGALLDRARSHTARVQLTIDPGDAVVRVDGGDPIDPRRSRVLSEGAHTISLTRAGYLDAERTVTVTGGERLSMDLRLDLRPPRESAPALPPATLALAAGARPRPRRVPAARVLGYVTLGVAPALATAAAVIWETGQSSRDSIAASCAPPAACTSVEIDARTSAASLRAHETWTNVSLAAAGISAATGLVLLLVTAGSTGSPDPAAAAVWPRAIGLTPRAAQIQFQF